MNSETELLEIYFRSAHEFAPHREEIRRLFSEDLGDERGMRFFVALNEAVNNALIHGMAGCPEGKVRLSIRRGGERIWVHVKSSGGIFTHDMKANGSLFQENRGESGRGIQIILHLVDGCDLKESGGLISMFMEKPVTVQGGKEDE